MSEKVAEIRVLHVDDEPDFADLVATFIERENERISVETATSAEEGLEVLHNREVDCVVSDQEMPGRTGIEFLEGVREEYPELPFILFTGRGSEEVASDAISAGVTDYLQKESGVEQYKLLANRIVNAVDAQQSSRVLTERTRRLETLISNLPGMIYRCRNEPTWPIEEVEGEVEDLTGYSPDYFEENTVNWGKEVVHPEDREAVWDTVQGALAEDETFEVTYRIVGKDGDTKWVWERGRGVYNDDGSLAVLEGFITDISGRKQREERLAQTTARLNALFENSPDMINVHDAEGNIVDANPRLCEETGFSEEELTDMKVWDLDQAIGPTEAYSFWTGMAEGERQELEGEFKRRDESTFPVKVHVRRLDLVGEDRFIVSSRDISKRKQREEKLMELRERTRDLNYTTSVKETAQLGTDAADEIIGAPLSGVHLLNDEETRLEPVAFVDSISDTFDEIPTYEQSAEPGTSAALVWEAYRENERIHVDDVSNSERITESSPSESVVLHPIGDHGLFIISSPEANAFSDTDLLLVEILANYLEAALDRVDREETLRAREDRLEQLHAATRDLFKAESRQGIADRIIEAAREILGFSITVVRFYDPEVNGLVPYAASDTVAERLQERGVFTPETGDLNWPTFEAKEVRVYEDIQTLPQAADHGTDLRSLMILPMGSHGTISVGETVPGAFDASDEFLARILATAAETALGEEKRERKLRRNRDELKRQNERLEEFANVVSHDLRNPLNVAEGRLELALEECDSGHLDDVAGALTRMNVLIDDLLTLAREGQEVGELEPVAIADIAERCWENVGNVEAATLVTDVEIVTLADGSRLQQLLENLVRNSIEHGGENVTVTVGELSDGFYVEDDGRGIPVEDWDDVFEPGYSTSGQGTGFGLSIVKQVAEAHGWDIRVRESDSGGARFEITGIDVVNE